MLTMSVLYRAPDDPEAFEKRYVDGHLPIVRRYSNMKDSSFQKVTRVLAGEFGYAYVFEGRWADKDGWRADMGSDLAKEAMADAQSFAPPFDVIVSDVIA
jgi:uncharacterized protein (TIGR02118 family)